MSWLGLLLFAAGCTPGEPGEVVARVNGSPIVALELDLARERRAADGEPALDASDARQRLLQSLVVEELLAQQFRRTSPGSAQVDRYAANAVERQMLARRFAANITAKVPPPTCEEIHAYYRSHPELFGRRQLFDLRRLEIPAPAPGGEKALRARLAAAASLDEVVDWLRKADLRFVMTQTELGPNELPAELAERLRRMSSGQVLVLPANERFQVVQLLGTRSAPLDEAGAWSQIERRLWQERQNAALEAEIEKLTGAAAISILKPASGPARAPPLSPQRPPATAAKSEGGPPAAFPSCSVQRIGRRSAEPRKLVEGLVQ